jgi:hypothetical protein
MAPVADRGTLTKISVSDFYISSCPIIEPHESSQRIHLISRRLFQQPVITV